MKCKNCGNILVENAISCSLCGSTDLEKITNQQEEMPSLIIQNEPAVQENYTYISTNNTKKNNGKVYLSIYLITVVVFFVLSIISGIFIKDNREGITAEEFKKYMKEKNYNVTDLTKYNYNYDYYYVAKNNNYSIIYMYSDDNEIINNSYISVKDSIIKKESSIVKNRIDINFNKFSKYSINDNTEYKIVVKKDKTLIFTSANAIYKTNIDNIFKELGYDYKINISHIFLILGLLTICLLFIVSFWKIFGKAGRKKIGSLIPIYNLYCLTDIAVGNGLLFLVMLIPIVNFVFLIYLYYKLAKMFGKSTSFAIGIIFLGIVFIPLLAFDDSEYLGIKKL